MNTMKTLAIAVLLLAGCDAAPGEAQQELTGPLLGKWTIVSTDGHPSTYPVGSYDFSSDGTVVEAQTPELGNGQWFKPYSGTWTLDADTLTVSWNDQTGNVATVSYPTATTLQLRWLNMLQLLKR
jgi:hypothetical protein